MNDDARTDISKSRRSFLRNIALLTGSALARSQIPLLGSTVASELGKLVAPESSQNLSNPINHVLVACQENRTFDEYFGYDSHSKPFGIPSRYYQPDGQGGKKYPHHFLLPLTPDISHSWQSVHQEYDGGKMDGFYTTDGLSAMGYYNQKDLPYYYSIADSFALCGNYFCYQLGPTLPNRLALWTGTSGGITTNSVSGASLDWQTIVDVLDLYNISWKCYNLGLGTGSFEGYNALIYFKKWAYDPRLYYKESDYLSDLNSGNLPQVSFLITESLISEHPPADIQWGQNKMKSIITALQSSPVWNSSALFLTYDEGGGYFDHVNPPQVDAYGMGMRVPMMVVSPWVIPGYVSGQLYEHSSVLKFIERLFNLPSLSSINHQFDSQTPGTNNDAANGNQHGPPAPPRDGLSQLGDFFEIFNFS